MNTAILSERAALQGYCTEDNRPTCSNCWAYAPRISSCSYGSFAAEPTGWCPLWLPINQWVDDNRRSAQKLGVAAPD